MKKNIALIYGDYSSPEVVTAAKKVFDAIAKKFGHEFNYIRAYMGGEAIDKYGAPLPPFELEKCKNSDSVLLGAVGGPKWDSLPMALRPERGLLQIRSGMGLYSNIRPAKIWKQLSSVSPLKDELVEKGIDFVVVRELTGGIYFGEHKFEDKDGEKYATDVMPYSQHEIERVGRVAIKLAKGRRKKLTCVHKSNILATSRLWKEVMQDLADKNPDIEYNDIYVDNCAMQICKDPSQFDVIVTGNMFGDILTDEASQITGSIGMAPSASLGDTTCGLYEPIHGSAPDIAGKDIVNPIACILSAAMMLRLSFNMLEEAETVEHAVGAMLDFGLRTPDIMQPGCTLCTCTGITNAIIEAIEMC